MLSPLMKERINERLVSEPETKERKREERGKEVRGSGPLRISCHKALTEFLLNCLSTRGI